MGYQDGLPDAPEDFGDPGVILPALEAPKRLAQGKVAKHVESGPKYPGLELESRRQVVNDIRKIAARVPQCSSGRLGIFINPTEMVEAWTNEIIAMPDQLYQLVTSSGFFPVTAPRAACRRTRRTCPPAPPWPGS